MINVSKACLFIFLPVMNMAKSTGVGSTNFINIFKKLFKTPKCFESIYDKLMDTVGYAISFKETGECLFD